MEDEYTNYPNKYEKPARTFLEREDEIDFFRYKVIIKYKMERPECLPFWFVR